MRRQTYDSAATCASPAARDPRGLLHLYQQAAELASQMKRPALEQIARAYWIGEELRALPPGHEESDEVDQVLGQAREKATPDLRIAIVRVERIRAKQRERAAM